MMTDDRAAVRERTEQAGAGAAADPVLGWPLAVTRQVYNALAALGLRRLGSQVRSVSSEHVSVDRGAVGAALGNRLRFRQSATGVALGRDVGLHQGGGLVVAGGRVTVEQGASQWLVGAVVEARQTFALAVIAGQVSGSVRCLLDTRGAFIFGVAFAVTTFALRLLTRRG
jgi:hypothetical protein